MTGEADAAIIPFGMSTEKAKIAELAALSVFDYERCREDEAKVLGARVSVLDKEVAAARPKEPDSDVPDPFEDVEPWPEPVDGAALLSDIRAVILRFCVLPDHSDVLVTAWVLHAWAHDAADISPILAAISPEKRCGKSTLLSTIAVLAPKPMHSVNMSTSVLFRVVEKYSPTVLIDEGDAYLTDNEELRGIINGGHNRLTAYVWRSVGDDFEPTKFTVWAPKCIAMIGKLPDTLEDRSIVVPLRRKQKGETVARFRADKLGEYLPLRRRAQRWADDNMARLRGMDPDVPDDLNDRAQDNARAMCAIADVAGGEWPQTVRAAFVGLAAQTDDDPQSAGVLLLRDISEILETRKGDTIGSADLCEALCALEDAPWAEWRRGSPITTRGIARLLKPFGIRPTRDMSVRFYRLADFADALTRYVSDTPKISVTSVTSVMRHPSVIEKDNKNNAMTHNDAYDACLEHDGNKCHAKANDGEF
jgi:putative DNA primase/helicase